MVFLILFLLWTSAFAGPMSEMRNRLEIYNQLEVPGHCAKATPGNNGTPGDYGIMTTVSCKIVCSDGKSVPKKALAAFIPSSYGLTPGDGSHGTNTLWRTLSVTMKLWSEEVCLDQANTYCEGLLNVKNTEVKSIDSGEWNLSHNPGCREKVPTLSPFDDSVKSNRIIAPLARGLGLDEKDHKLPLYKKIYQAAKIKDSGICKNKMNYDICFGDCVHEMKKGGDWKETLASPEPLGTDKGTWCMDGFVNLMKNEKKVNKNIKVKMCEAYFWNNMMHSHSSGSSCASIRGEHDCKKIVDSL